MKNARRWFLSQALTPFLKALGVLASAWLLVRCSKARLPAAPSATVPSTPSQPQTTTLLEAVRKIGQTSAQAVPYGNLGAVRIHINGSPNFQFRIKGQNIGIGPPLPDDQLTLNVPAIEIPADAEVSVV